MGKMDMTVNAWRAEWDSGNTPETCHLAIECSGEVTTGVCHFSNDGRPVSWGPRLFVPCCKNCAAAYVMREGLKGTITMKQIVEALTR